MDPLTGLLCSCQRWILLAVFTGERHVYCGFRCSAVAAAVAAAVCLTNTYHHCTLCCYILQMSFCRKVFVYVWFAVWFGGVGDGGGGVYLIICRLRFRDSYTLKFLWSWIVEGNVVWWEDTNVDLAKAKCFVYLFFITDMKM